MAIAVAEMAIAVAEIANAIAEMAIAVAEIANAIAEMAIATEGGLTAGSSATV